MAQPWVPGPVHCFVSNSDDVTYYLGLTQRGADIQIQTRLGDYVVDMGGGTPLDKYNDGQSATVTLDLVRWDMNTYIRLANKSISAPFPTVGVEVPGDIGTLFGFENEYWKLLLVFPYSRKAAYTGQPAGYRFVRTMPDRDGLPERGARPSRLRLSFQCWRALDMSFSNAYGPGLMTLYDFTVGAASTVPIT